MATKGKKQVPEFVTDKEAPEGFRPVQVNRRPGTPVPSAVKEETARREPTKVFLKREDVPEKMRLNVQPEAITRMPGAPDMKDVEKAQAARMEARKKRALDKAVEAAKNPGKSKLLAALAEARKSINAAGAAEKEVKSDEREEETRPEAE